MTEFNIPGPKAVGNLDESGLVTLAMGPLSLDFSIFRSFSVSEIRSTIQAHIGELVAAGLKHVRAKKELSRSFFVNLPCWQLKFNVPEKVPLSTPLRGQSASESSLCGSGDRSSPLGDRDLGSLDLGASSPSGSTVAEQLRQLQLQVTSLTRRKHLSFAPGAGTDRLSALESAMDGLVGDGKAGWQMPVGFLATLPPDPTSHRLDSESRKVLLARYRLPADYRLAGGSVPVHLKSRLSALAKKQIDDLSTAQSSTASVLRPLLHLSAHLFAHSVKEPIDLSVIETMVSDAISLSCHVMSELELKRGRLLVSDTMHKSLEQIFERPVEKSLLSEAHLAQITDTFDSNKRLNEMYRTLEGKSSVGDPRRSKAEASRFKRKRGTASYRSAQSPKSSRQERTHDSDVSSTPKSSSKSDWKPTPQEGRGRAGKGAGRSRGRGKQTSEVPAPKEGSARE
jgi:hypothetical protein